MTICVCRPICMLYSTSDLMHVDIPMIPCVSHLFTECPDSLSPIPLHSLHSRHGSPPGGSFAPPGRRSCWSVDLNRWTSVDCASETWVATDPWHPTSLESMN